MINARQPYDFLCNHLVALTATFNRVDANGQPVGQPHPIIAAGCILSFRDDWAWLTAGHILEDIEVNLRDPSIKLMCSLADHFGPNAIDHHSIPFDYDSAPKIHVYDTQAGIDFGLVSLLTQHKQQMKKNGIQPITERDWMRLQNVEFDDDKHFMLGFTKPFTHYEPQRSPNDPYIEAHIQPVCLPITKLPSAPDRFTTPYPRFVGKLNDAFPFDDIEGMSGGPIFGFGKKEQNRYWIVAIQSGWFRPDRIIFGCPIQIIATPIEAFLREAVNRTDNS